MLPCLTEGLATALLVNGAASAASEGGIDHAPVVRIFMPDGGATWLLSEIDPDNPDIAFGLCDLGMGYAELGYVSLAELASLRGGLNLPVECDKSFAATKRLSEYALD